MAPLMLKSSAKQEMLSRDTSVVSAFRLTSADAKMRDDVKLDAITSSIRARAADTGPVNVLHVQCYGHPGEVVWENDGDNVVDVEAFADAVAAGFEPPHVRDQCLVVLTVCWSEELAAALHARGFANVIYATGALPVRAAGSFCQHLYAQLAVGVSWMTAFAAADHQQQHAGIMAVYCPMRAKDFAPLLDLPLSAGVDRLPTPYTGPPSKLLVARYEVVPFEGRDAVLAELAAWCMSADHVAVRVVHGAGGVGKTRAMIELVQRLRVRGALAGFLQKSVTADKFKALADADRCAVAVLDYADSFPRLHELLRALAELRDGAKPGRLRVVLLARSAGDWVAVAKEIDTAVGDLLAATPPLRLDALEVPAATAFGSALAAFAVKLGTSVPTQTAPDLTHTVYRRVLYVHMAALATLLGVPFTADSLVDEIVMHETRAWDAELLQKLGGDAAVQLAVFQSKTRLVMAMTTLRGGVGTETAARALAERMRLRLPDWVVDGVLQLLHRQYGETSADATSGTGESQEPGRYLAPLEPDVLGEALVHRALAPLEPERAHELLAAVFADDDVGALVTAFAVFARMSSDRGGVEPWITAVLEADIERRGLLAFLAILSLAGGESADDRLRVVHTRLGQALERSLRRDGTPQTAFMIAGLLPRESVALREVAAWARSRMTEAQVTREDPDGQRRHAAALANESIAEADLGHREVALRLAERAVQRARALVSVSPDDIENLAVLQGCLTTLSNALDGVGQRDAAASTASETVEANRRLYVLDPERFLPNLAVSLNNLGNRQNALGQREAALASTTEAVATYRELARARPDAFLPYLAGSLNNLGAMQNALGQREAALASTAEAVATYRELARTRPDAFLPDLAASLNNLGAMQTALGQREAALASTAEALAMYHGLARTRPDAFLPDLAASLNNMGIRQSALGQREAALASTTEAVATYRELARARPDAFLPDLASSLSNLGIRQDALGQREAALASTAEAVATYRELARARPDAFLPNLAASLNNLGIRQDALGQREAALASTTEAVATYRELARARPDAFLPNLAGSLNNLGMMQNALGQRETALVSTEKAVAIRRELARARPDAFLPNLAGSLKNLADIHLGLANYDAAVVTAQQSLTLYRALARTLPERFTEELPDTMHILGKALFELGRQADAMAALCETADLLAPLAMQRPAVFIRKYAAAARDLGDRVPRLPTSAEGAATAEAAVRHLGLFASLDRTEYAPRLASCLAYLADCQQAAGEVESAARSRERAVAVLFEAALDGPAAEAAVGTDSDEPAARSAAILRQRRDALERTVQQATGPDLVEALNSLAYVCSRLGKHAQAVAHLDRALALCREHGADDATTASILDSLGEILTTANEPARAVERLNEAVDLYARLGQADTAVCAASLANLAEAHTRLGETALARAFAERAVALFAAHPGEYEQYAAKAARLHAELQAAPP